MDVKLPEVSIVIVTYNNVKYTKGCIESVIKYTSQIKTPYEIIVVDNHSTDQTVEYLKHVEKGGLIKCIYNLHNKGFPAANNQGVALADQVLIGDQVAQGDRRGQGGQMVLVDREVPVVQGGLEGLGVVEIHPAHGAHQSSSRPMGATSSLWLSLTALLPTIRRQASNSG